MRVSHRLILLAVLAPAAHSQTTVYTFDGDSMCDWFGATVSGAGDVNGDGYGDVIVGARYTDKNGKNSGSARVLSGENGRILYTFNGDSQGDFFGISVSGAGDVNADGFADVIVGAPRDDNNGMDSGSARVLSGVDGTVLYAFDGDAPLDSFGVSVSGAGDVNGDGHADVIVGADRSDSARTNTGSARVFSGLDGSTLYTFTGDNRGDLFGASVSGAGDVNADGYDDLIVGAFGDDNNNLESGSARIFSGVDGSVLYTFDGDSRYDRFGLSVSGAGDVNGDGYADLIVGASGDDNNGLDSGSARVFSGVDGTVLYTLDGDSIGDAFGYSVSGAGDVSGDGFEDVIAGAPNDRNNGTWSGSARVFSGVDGRVLYTLDGDSPFDAFGVSVSGASDVNGDGHADVIVGAYRDDNNGADSGSARVFSGWSPVGTNYCGPAVPNSTGLPATVLALGSEAASENQLWLLATDLPPGQFGYFLASETQGFVASPGGSQGNLCLGGQIARYVQQAQNSGPSGKLTLQVDLVSIPTNPPHSVMTGETWNFQAWFRDMNPGNTSNFTDGVSVTFS